MRITKRCRHGETTTFWVANGGRYVFQEDRGCGTTGTQICKEGGYYGETISADKECLKEMVDRWIRSRRHRTRAEGYCWLCDYNENLPK